MGKADVQSHALLLTAPLQMTIAVYFFFILLVNKEKAQTPVGKGIRARAEGLQYLSEHGGTQHSARAGYAH